MRQVFVAWTRYQRRQETMQAAVGFEIIYIPPSPNIRFGKAGKAIDYLRQIFITINHISKRDISVVWLQLPPTFLAHVAVLLRFAARGQYKIILDCHNAAVRNPWAGIPGFAFFAGKAELILVHSESARTQAIEAGLPESKIRILADMIPDLMNSDAARLKNHVLVPCSFNADEPIETILSAARLLPDVHFWLTGNKNKALTKGFVDQAPPNVEFTGFVSTEQYENLLRSAEAVIGITSTDGIQLSAAVEAIGAGKALLLSDTSTLRKLFGDAAVFALNEPEPMAKALAGLLAEVDAAQLRAKGLFQKRVGEWQKEFGSATQPLETATQR